MIYEWEYLVFSSDEPTVDDIKEKLENDESCTYESDHEDVDGLAEQIVEENNFDWELEDGDYIYISIFPKGKPEEQELFCVRLELVISCTAHREWYGLDK